MNNARRRNDSTATALLHALYMTYFATFDTHPQAAKIRSTFG